MKRNLQFSLLFAGIIMTFMCFIPNIQAQDLSNGLDYHFTFESEVDGVVTDVVSGAGGTLSDGAVIDVVDGKNVLSLSGGAANTTSPYLNFEDAVGTTIQSYTDFSISCWVKLNSAATWARIFDFGSGTDYYMFFTVSNGSTPRFSFKNGGSEDQLDAQTALPLDRWVHLVVTLDGTVGKIYLNGVVDAQNNNMVLNPSLITETFSQNYIGRSMWPDPFLDGYVADFRVYNRAVTESEVLELAGLPEELITAHSNLTVEGIEEVSGDLTFPESDGNVSISWETSDTTIIDSLGHVTPPEKYAITVVLTATLSMEVDGQVYTMIKKFDANVPATSEAADLIAQWSFDDEDIDFSDPSAITVADVSENAFTGQLYNEAKIRTIGETNPFNVLDLGNGTGYFDMGTDIGKEIYQLGDYTISAYYLIEEENTDISSNGNFLWCIGNTDDIDTDRNGAMIERLVDHRFSITPTIWGGDQQAVNPGVRPADEEGWKEKWHHVLYVQSGSTGTVYIDGQQAATGNVSNLPATSLKKPDREGTLFNWIGRSCYTADVYLKNALVYDFRLYGIALTEPEIQTTGSFGGVGLDVLNVLDDLNAAYDENDDASYPTELDAEFENLELGDLSNLTTNLDLPTEGQLDNSVSISWSCAPGLISPEGVVTRPDYLDTDVKLTASISKRGYVLTKVFEATIPANEATKYTSDLLLHFNFAEENVDGTTVTDLSEQHFEGTLVNNAYTRKYSFNDEDYGVLMLWNDSAYFDMGDEVGKVIYALKGNYSISTYFLVDPNKTDFGSNGNFLFTFSNSDSSASYRNGYMYGRATSTSFNISPKRWDDGQVGTAGGAQPTLGEWHHYVYTQDDTIGIVYVDGVPIDTATVNKWPNNTIAKPGLLGTMYNFLGRANFEGDVMLNNAQMYDFQLYNRTLTPEEVIQKNDDVTENLYYAYLSVLPNKDVRTTEDYRVDTSIPGMIRIFDLKGDEKVSVYNLIGRQVTVKNVQNISVDRGIYIVKVNDSVKKVLVK